MAQNHHRKTFTTDDVMYARKIARDANILLTRSEWTGKDEQTDSKEFENNSYSF